MHLLVYMIRANITDTLQSEKYGFILIVDNTLSIFGNIYVFVQTNIPYISYQVL